MSAVVSGMICANVSADSLAKVKINKIRISHKIYKGLKSVKPLKWGKIKYNYGKRASWKKVKGAGGYEIHVYSVAMNTWKKLKTIKKNSYIFTNLMDKDKFKIRVRAYRENADKVVYGDWSKTKTVKANCLMSKYKKNHKLVKPFYDRYASEQAFVLQNKYRKGKNVDKLKWSEDLYNVCKLRAKQIAKNYSHKGFIKTSTEYFEKKYGIKEATIEVNNITENGGRYECYSLASGENIAKGQTNYKSVCKAWKNSDGHYRNMIRKDNRVGAVACYRTDNKTLWVAVFGEISKKVISM